jgi:hypothetical protein
MHMHRRSLFALAGAAVLCGRRSTLAGQLPQAVPSVTVLSAPMEVTGTWGGSPPQAAARVIARLRAVALADVRLVSDRQPQRLRVEDRASGPPAIWLHAAPAATAWIVVDIGPRDWCKLAYQFGHELGHVLCNSWGPLARPAPPSQWLEEALVEGFSLRGLGLLAASWERDPPFSGDFGFAIDIREYRADLVRRYRAAAPPGQDIAACYRSQCRDFTQGKGDALVLAVRAEMAAEPSCVEDLGALNRWPARSAVPAKEYLALWRNSCGELGTCGLLPTRLQTVLGLG